MYKLFMMFDSNQSGKPSKKAHATNYKLIIVNNQLVIK
jgi:hypothetical protein